MGKGEKQKSKQLNSFLLLLLIALLGVFTAVYFKLVDFGKGELNAVKDAMQAGESGNLPKPELDVAAYDKKLMEIANLPASLSAASSTPPPQPSPNPHPASGHLPPKGEGNNEKALGGGKSPVWPVKAAYPNAGALLPFNRVIAYYGNLYSKNMGVLGEYPEEVMLNKLSAEVKKWQTADPNTPAIPALHYIAVVAQAGPGRDGKYRARMPDKEIDKVLEMAKKMNALVFLDVQVGLSGVQAEIPLLEKYLKLPNVHLGIDPEFSMKGGEKPGTVIGTYDADDINFAAEYLSDIVKENNLPPKILVVHRFTQPMVTNYQNIKPLPEVQVVMNMDGFGGKGNKLNTYKQYIYKEPVQFTGFKLFYYNDVNRGNGLLSPGDLLKLTPIPVYIQYQ